MKTGIFGGSFDPVHNGHLAAARAVLERAKLDEIWFVPARVSPLKIGQMRAGDEHRLEMLRLALDGEPRFALNDYELRKGGVSYTIDTIRHFRAERPDDDFSLIIGADSLATFPRWKDADQIMRLCRVIVLARRAGNGSQTGVENPPSENNGMQFISDFDYPISSTEIRRKTASSEDMSAFLPPLVAEYVRCHGLYTAR